MQRKAALFLACLALHLEGRAAFFIPEIPEGAQTEFAGWDLFSDPYTDYQLPQAGEAVSLPLTSEGNSVNHPDADNTDAKLYQTGTSTAFITSSQGIYSFAEPVQFLIHDTPVFEADSVILQTSSLGSLPDLDGIRLFYRETSGGVLLEADGPKGTGFLNESDLSYAFWEWDLSNETVFDYFISFGSSDSTMSLQEVQLDTFDEVTDELGFALVLETTSNFSTVGEIEHNLLGEAEPKPSYREGDTIELTPVATEGFGHIFVGWGGALSGDQSPETVLMEEGISVLAVFAPTTYASWRDNQINPYEPSAPYNARADIEADPDGDGLTNLLEYALGGLPESASDLAEIQPRMSINEQGYAQLTFRRQIAATDLEYRVRVSSNLQTWNHNGDGTGFQYTEELPNPVFNEDGTETVTVRALTPLAPGESYFLRLEVIHTEE